ncbi:MAG TPA: hypothetical protein VNO18_13805 [Xanthobacteraceae bacterium]|jgi:hypothetical protein|nr:hypothetical protein [Xanthobacteraceae bacterium]
MMVVFMRYWNALLEAVPTITLNPSSKENLRRDPMLAMHHAITFLDPGGQ